MKLAFALVVGVLSQGSGRFRQAEVELRGPLAALEIAVLGPTAGSGETSTRLELDLAPGELRRVSVPLFASAECGDPALRELPQSEGSAMWTGWTREGEAEFAQAWLALPIGLRTRPSVALFDGVAGREPEPAALLFSAALFVLVLALRRRPALALASGLATGAVLVAWLARRDIAPRELRVLEGAGDGAWVAWDSGFESLRVPATAPLQLEVEPRSAAVRAHGRLSPSGVGELTLEARGALLRRASPVDAGHRRISAAANGWGALEEVWVRSEHGRWSVHGPWEAGEPLPEGRAGDPPGGFNPALPQGTAVVIARLAPGTFSAGASAARPVWLRWIGPAEADSGLPR
ncbi:MAG: hypothetical protein FJ294_05335 [Planctomycetes bacterium]|nr:hypothetical protein [Planctomycetota bacterium]